MLHIKNKHYSEFSTTEFTTCTVHHNSNKKKKTGGYRASITVLTFMHCIIYIYKL